MIKCSLSLSLFLYFGATPGITVIMISIVVHTHTLHTHTHTHTPAQSVHCPIEAPESYVQPYLHLAPQRQVFAGMLAALDEAVGRVYKGFTDKGMTDNLCVCLPFPLSFHHLISVVFCELMTHL